MLKKRRFSFEEGDIVVISTHIDRRSRLERYQGIAPFLGEIGEVLLYHGLMYLVRLKAKDRTLVEEVRKCGNRLIPGQFLDLSAVRFFYTEELEKIGSVKGE